MFCEHPDDEREQDDDRILCGQCGSILDESTDA